MYDYESYAEYYHDLTKYTPEGVATNKHRIDFSKQPVPFKKYPGKEIVDIAYLLPLDRNPFSDKGIKNPSEFTDKETLLASLSKLLYLTNGITAVVPYEDKPFYMRAAPSAGGLYPTEIYLCVSDFKGLKDGIYNYQPLNQTLILLEEGDLKSKFKSATFENPNVENSNVLLIFTGVFYRSSWRYQDRAYRRICLDTGHVFGNTSLVSKSCGFKASCIGGFIDDEINAILNLNPEEEQALMLVSLTNKDDEENEFPSALPSGFENKDIKTAEGHRLIQLHNRSKIEKKIKVPDIKISDVEEKFKFSPAISLDKYENQISINNLTEVMLKRRSTRAYTGESITKEELSNMLDYSYHAELFASENIDTKPSYYDPDIIDTFIAVNNVNGLEEGCYFYSVEGRYLRQVRFKNLREEVHYICLGQEIGKTASAVIFHTCDLSKAVFKYGERAYRYLHLDAGHIGQRLNIAAISMDLGVSGIGGFFDDQVNDLLGIPEHEVVIYITTLGVPLKQQLAEE